MVFLYQSVGLAGFLVQPAVLMGPVLYVLRRRPLPVGSLTVLLSVNVALMAIIHDKYLDTGPVPLIGAAVLAGALGDVLLWGLRPSPDRPLAFRAVAFAVPALQYLFYFVAVLGWARLDLVRASLDGRHRDRGRRGVARQLPRAAAPAAAGRARNGHGRPALTRAG